MNNRRDMIPNNLREYRTRSGLTQQQAANFLGFATTERISLWEKGRNIPNIVNLFKLCALYNASPFELYSKLQSEIYIAIQKIEGSRKSKSDISNGVSPNVHQVH